MSDASNVNAVDSMSISFPESPSANKARIYNNTRNKVLVKVKVLLSHRDDNDTDNNRAIILNETELQKCITFHYVGDDRECFRLSDKGGHGPIGYDTNPYGYKDPGNRYDKAYQYVSAFSLEKSESEESMNSDTNYSYANFWINAHQAENGSSDNVPFPIYARFSNGSDIPNSDTKGQNILIESVKQLNCSDKNNWVSPASKGFDVSRLNNVTNVSFKVTKHNRVTGGWEDISGALYSDTIRFTLVNNALIRKAVMRPDSSQIHSDFCQASGGGNYDANEWWFRDFPVTRKIKLEAGVHIIATYQNLLTDKVYTFELKSDYTPDVLKEATNYLLFYRFDFRIKEDDLEGGWSASDNRIIDVTDEYGNKGAVTFSLQDSGSNLGIVG